jgi:hypothetical protein
VRGRDLPNVPLSRTILLSRQRIPKFSFPKELGFSIRGRRSRRFAVWVDPIDTEKLTLDRLPDRLNVYIEEWNYQETDD